VEKPFSFYDEPTFYLITETLKVDEEGRGTRVLIDVKSGGAPRSRPFPKRQAA
jgi:hypothetical protein